MLEIRSPAHFFFTLSFRLSNSARVVKWLLHIIVVFVYAHPIHDIYSTIYICIYVCVRWRVWKRLVTVDEILHTKIVFIYQAIRCDLSISPQIYLLLIYKYAHKLATIWTELTLLFSMPWNVNIITSCTKLKSGYSHCKGLSRNVSITQLFWLFIR